MDVKKLKLAIEQAQKVCTEMNKCTNKFILQDSINEMNQGLTLTDVVNCVYVVTERDNYGEQLFKGVFANREKAVEYLAEDGLKESNIDEINEIELN
jgi:hypothetical protein